MIAPRPTTALRQRMIQDLQLAGRSERTQEAYVRAVRKLADHYRQSPDRLTEPQVRDYFLYLKNDRRFSPSALKIAHSGIKFFYTRCVPRDWATLLKLRVPKQKTLPDVLTVDEVHRPLGYHPHVHYVVPGGAVAADGTFWIPSGPAFFLPVKALSILFRTKFRDELRKAGLLEQVDPAV